MYRVLAGDLATGKIQVWNLPAKSAQAVCSLNGAGTITATVQLPLRDPHTGTPVDVVNKVVPGRSFLALAWGETIINAGPIWNDSYDTDTAIWTINAAGLRSYFDHRFVLPVLANAAQVRTAYTTIGPYDLRTIARQLVMQAQTWTNGSLPIVYKDQDVLTGTETRRYAGWALHRVGTALADLTAQGPDIDFIPAFGAEGYVKWLMVTGSPELVQSGPDFLWDTSAPGTNVKGGVYTRDASALVTDAYVSGGTADDGVTVAAEDGSATDQAVNLFGTASDSTLLQDGYVRMEGTDSAYSGTQDTLNQKATVLTTQGRYPTETWKFDANLNVPPTIDQFRVGAYGKVAFRGSPYFQDGTYRVRVVGITADIANQFATITATPARYDSVDTTG